MRAPLHLVAALALAAAPALAADAKGGPSVDQRIEQGLFAADQMEDGAPSVGGAAVPRMLGGRPSDAQADVSLSAPTGATRLRTTLAPVDIEQRIDKGLTAAGESSTFPPDYAYGAFQRGWFLTAFSLALERAKTGDAKAETLLGVLQARGLGVKQDLAAAADWYKLAGEAGDAEALYALGQMYMDGRGVKEDEAKAADLFRQAADADDHPGASRELGYLLLEGKGVDKNAMLAAAYLRRAAAQGDMDAQYTLGGLYVEGVGVAADDGQAARWYGEAAHSGHVGAEVEYALMLLAGRGVTKDEAGAASWLSHAANADNPVAQVRLARLLVEGRGVDADPAAAARWYMIAKAQGLDDKYMEDWLATQDPAIRKAAEKAADDWIGHGPKWVEASAAPARPAPAPVDNAVE